MRYLMILFVVLNCTAIGQVPPPPYILNSGGMNTGNMFISNEYKVFMTGQVSNDAVLDIQASQEILLQSVTDINAFSQNGRYRAAIKPGSFDPISYHPNGWTNIGKWDRFEIGISLPLTVDQQVEDFLNGVITAGAINPYDYDQIKLKGIYTNGSNSYERFGFYYRDITSTNNGTSYTQNKSNKPFRIRFAPNAVGYWTVHLELIVNGSVIGTFDGHFDCIDIGKPGPVSIGPHNRFQFEGGNTFFPIGQDFGPLIHNNGPNQCGSMMQPNDVTEYIGHITNLADQGGNFIRMPMDIHNFALEWEEARVYGANRKPNENFKRQFSANSLDKVLDKIESRNVYSILLTETDQVFHIESAYKCGNVSETEWPAHPYAALTNYGIYEPLDVFSKTNLFNDVYKKRLFYIQARYGYSPNLAAYEICNEVDGIQKGNNLHYENNSATRDIVYDWAVNTANYFKSLYPYHMATISFRDISLQDPANVQNPTSNSAFDFRSPHHYGKDIGVPIKRAKNVSTQLYGHNGSEMFPETTRKPVLFGEMGMSDEMGKADTCTDVEFHKGMWASGCSGAAGAGLYRYGYESDNKRNLHFPALHAFFDNMPFATDEFTPHRELAPLISITPGGIGQEDPTTGIIYNSSHSGHKAYGWLYSVYFYWANDPYLQPYCIPNQGMGSPPAGTPNDQITVRGFQNGQDYNVELWRTYGGGGVQFFFQETATLLGGNIKLKRQLGSCITCEYAPDYGVKIYKEDGQFRMAYADEFKDNNKGDIYLINDTMDWQKDGFQVTGKFNPNNTYHHWDFGDGNTSDEQYPFVIFSQPGTYHVVYATLNSQKDTVRYHQTAVVLENQPKTGNISDHQTSTGDKISVEIVPNPSTGIFKIIHPLDVTVNTINVYDSKGSMILSSKENTSLINLSKFSNGLYNIVIFTDKNVIYKKVVKIE
ncbi:hypothetical protein DBR32_12520 [Taibaiella sp. KBW10]|uniref:T9SS type A sorting domain-containing protein n=1 Tax=Taibaiella sp. KBW10 TaxID=2153357 RepID=UPI000F5A442A|nr:T9SS type A sorting domain-containing protein [Taibaiella sp. KBW10]RQO30387.1 hypothetical protein DBR32_12520 [Taibaiella sp. KBW10]